MIYGYIRVSTEKQDVDKQRLEILDYSQKNSFQIDEFIEVKMSSKKNTIVRRIEELIKKLEEGDKVIVVELSRLGRSMIDVLQIVERIHNKGATIDFLRQPFLNTSEGNPFQKVIMSVFAVFAEVERDFISMRTKAGLEKAKLSKTLGRPKGSLGVSKVDKHAGHIKELVGMEVPIKSIARIVGVSESTLRRWAENRNIPLMNKEKMERRNQKKIEKLKKELESGNN